MKHKARSSSFSSWLLAALTLLLAGMLIIQCLRLYSAGVSPQNLTEAGVRLHDIYSPELIAQYARPLLLPFALWLAVLAACCVQRRTPQPTSKPRAAEPQPAAAVPSHLTAVRMLLFLAALSLITAGVLNGGLYDVLVKAINICTECIGLG